MDPITLAIITAITAGMVSGSTEAATQVIIDLYAKLINQIKQKYGKDSDLNKAIDSLENKPKSDALKKVVEKEVASVKADKDQEILIIAQKLLEILKAQPGVEQSSQTAIGSNIVQADRGGKASLNITRSRKNNHD